MVIKIQITGEISLIFMRSKGYFSTWQQATTEIPLGAENAMNIYDILFPALWVAQRVREYQINLNESAWEKS